MHAHLDNPTIVDERKGTIAADMVTIGTWNTSSRMSGLLESRPSKQGMRSLMTGRRPMMHGTPGRPSLKRSEINSENRSKNEVLCYRGSKSFATGRHEYEYVHELEKHVEKLPMELQSKNNFRDALETTSKYLEKKMLDLNLTLHDL
ncbi:hypothetical protein Tco_1218318 [Tanacetum coccineum]